MLLIHAARRRLVSAGAAPPLPRARGAGPAAEGVHGKAHACQEVCRALARVQPREERGGGRRRRAACGKRETACGGQRRARAGARNRTP